MAHPPIPISSTLAALAGVGNNTDVIGISCAHAIYTNDKYCRKIMQFTRNGCMEV
jgi:hypothetical protein